jgi:hypothetical protein
MATKRADVVAFVLRYFSDQFHLPPSYFKESDNVRKAWLFDDKSLVALGKAINQAEWHDAYVTPLEMVKCKTIKDIIDLVFSKI